ncbi:MAG: M14 family metallopeptidase, partial [Actinomycetota bacterium]
MRKLLVMLARPSALCLAWSALAVAGTLAGPPARAAGAAPVSAADRVRREKVTSPLTFFGHEIGADYVLPNYQQLTEYWRKLDRESDRMRMVEMGKTAEGRTQYMAILSAPSNLRNLDKYRSIARRLALAEDLTDDQARELAEEGKAVVWIDGGLHANEVLGAQQLLETVYQLVSRNDSETRRILDEVIVLAVHANPDGMDLVSDWYMRNPDPKKRSSAALPRLYQKYIGHDNNRDFYAATQPETRNMNRVMYREWFPQIVYNHHQTGPAGTVMFAPPFRDPFNYYFDPLIVTQLDLVGAAMHSRFAAEGKPGVTMRSGANYSTWWNGGLRTTAYFHNMIGLLTETIGHPTPMQIPFLIGRQLPRADLPNPIAPQTWRFRQSVDYSVTANYAVLDLAARQRETFLYRIYRMGRNSIERGSGDYWTVTPQRLEKVRSARAGKPAEGAAADAESLRLLRVPANQDPRGYILPSSQPDFPTATKFVNALIENGITVHQARSEFTVGGKSYPAGSYVVKTAHAFRPHILDMFEPQDHPNDFQYPGGPPVAPYDSAGWTLAFQMGLQFDRVLDGFDGPFEKIEGMAKTPAGRVVKSEGPVAGYLLQHGANDAFIAVNRLLKADTEIYWLTTGSAGAPAGAFFIPARRGAPDAVEKLSRDLGLTFQAVAARPLGAAIRV